MPNFIRIMIFCSLVAIASCGKIETDGPGQPLIRLDITMDSVEPSEGYVGDIISIKGKGLSHVMGVYVGSTSAIMLTRDNDELTFEAPNVSTASAFNVRIETNDGKEYTSAGAFTYLDDNGDGVPDISSALCGIDAFDTDEDGDSVSDLDECNIYHSDPNEADTDGDGVSDGDEVANGTSLINFDSDCDGDPDGSDLAPILRHASHAVDLTDPSRWMATDHLQSEPGIEFSDFSFDTSAFGPVYSCDTLVSNVTGSLWRDPMCDADDGFLNGTGYGRFYFRTEIRLPEAAAARSRIDKVEIPSFLGPAAVARIDLSGHQLSSWPQTENCYESLVNSDPSATICDIYASNGVVVFGLYVITHLGSLDYFQPDGDLVLHYQFEESVDSCSP